MTTALTGNPPNSELRGFKQGKTGHRHGADADIPVSGSAENPQLPEHFLLWQECESTVSGFRAVHPPVGFLLCLRLVWFSSFPCPSALPPCFRIATRQRWMDSGHCDAGSGEYGFAPRFPPPLLTYVQSTHTHSKYRCDQEKCLCAQQQILCWP